MTDHSMFSILIVDDNQNNLFTLRALLESSLKADVIEANCGSAALEKVVEQKIDLILLDIQMPDLDGFEVARLIRSRKQFQDIPIIFLTAVFKSEEFKQQGFDSGAIDYLTKPIDDTILLSRVRAYLRVIEGERTVNRRLSEMNDTLQQEIDRRTEAEAELARLNQQLQDGSQHKSDFLSSMSHEIRTPLNALIGYLAFAVSSLETKLDGDDLDTLVKASRTSRVVLQLINDILDFSKIESGKMETFIEEVDLEEIIYDVGVTAEGLLLEKPVELTTDIGPELPEVFSDFTKLKQMLNNLVGNAVKFTTEGYVAIRANAIEDGRAIRIEVEDSGPGIPPDKIDTVFESFKQVDSSIKKKYGGTGLGMAITKKFCDMLGIEIGIQSEEGKGTTFWLHIPVESSKVSDDVLPKDTVQSEGSASKEQQGFQSILIIDDEEMNRQVMSEAFKQFGYHVYTACSGAEGIQLASQEVPDVILTDLGMPDMDGLETTRCLRKTPTSAEIPIIACSAHVTPEIQENAFMAGCNGFISKPIGPSDLVREVLKIVSNPEKTQAASESEGNVHDNQI